MCRLCTWRRISRCCCHFKGEAEEGRSQLTSRRTEPAVIRSKAGGGSEEEEEERDEEDCVCFLAYSVCFAGTRRDPD